MSKGNEAVAPRKSSASTGVLVLQVLSKALESFSHSTLRSCGRHDEVCTTEVQL